ncbi:MAG: glycosyltransferase family 4 protein [Pseudomonadota bacterium]
MMPKPGRLLNVNTYHYRRGGSDVVYFEHAAMLAEQGWDNAFFAMHHPKNEPTPWSRYFVEEMEFGHDYSLPRKVSMATKVVYSFEAQRKLRQLIGAFRPDVAHLHCIYHHLSPSILHTLRSAGVPTVMTAHDLKIACPAYKMLNSTGLCERCKDGSIANVVRFRCIKDSLSASLIIAAESYLHRWLQTYQRCLDRIVVPSRFLLEKFVEWGWARERFTYIPNYVDASRFEPDYGPGDHALYFGRLMPEKGLATLIRAAAAASLPLKLVGTGPMEADARRLVEETGARAEFLGYQSGRALHDLVRRARVVVLPSEIYENAPMSVLEGYALGKPVIGARIGGIPELIVEGQTGWTFESGNVDALVQALNIAFQTPDSALQQMGEHARAHVERSFSATRYLQSTLELYAGLLGKQRASAALASV